MAAIPLAPSGQGPAASAPIRVPRTGRDGLFLTPPAILVIGLLTTVAATWVAHSAVQARDRNRFYDTVDEVMARVGERRRALGMLIRSAAGVFGLDHDVTPEEFRAYITDLDLGRTYAGIVSTGFAARVPAADLPAVAERLHADYGATGAVWSLGPGPEHYPTVLIQPETDGNLRFLGFDMTSEPLRAAVLQRSAEVSGPVASERLEFLPGTAPEPRVGYILACPVYRGADPAAPQGAGAGGGARLAGFVFAACRAHDLLGELVLPGPGRHYRLTVYDGEAPDPGHILFADDAEPRPARTPLVTRRVIDVHHRPWTLEFITTPSFAEGSAAWFVPVLAVGGMGLTLAVATASFTGARAAAAIRRLGRRLTRSERTLQRIVESGLVGIAVFDRRWQLREYNEAFLDLFGYTREDLRERCITIDDLTQDSAQALERRAAISAGQSIGPFERDCIKKDGTPITVLAGAAPLNEEGDIIAFAMDITAQHHAEAEVHRLNATLESKVERRTAELRDVTAQLEVFARNVSHDLRTPLRAIEGFAMIVLERLPRDADPECRSAAGRIADAARRMEAMIVGLLEVSRLSRSDLPLGPVSLDEATDEALASQTEILRASGAHIDVARPMPVVLAHRQVLVQALANLIGNAAKFVPRGEQPRIVVRAERSNAAARVIVEDSGIGLPAAPGMRENLFHPFARLHGREAYEGTGLGLAVARAGVERMGGRIGLEDNEPKGARFWIELPLAPPAAGLDGDFA